jgi:hypothetical protein
LDTVTPSGTTAVYRNGGVFKIGVPGLPPGRS